MALREALLVIENKGQLAAFISKWLRSRGRHCVWVKAVDVISLLLESSDEISAILLIDDDPVEDSLVNNLKMLRQWSRTVPIVVTTVQNNSGLEKEIRELGIFYFHTKIDGMADLKTAVVCALDLAVKENLFLTPPPESR